LKRGALPNSEIALVLDTGALFALQANRPRIKTAVVAAHSRNTPIVLPANVVAEWWRDGGQHQHEVLEQLKPFDFREVDLSISQLAGRALAWYTDDFERGQLKKFKTSREDRAKVTATLTVDATVLATAALVAGTSGYYVTLYTNDQREDFKRLMGFSRFMSGILLAHPADPS
jgi:hypothetical protein